MIPMGYNLPYSTDSTAFQLWQWLPPESCQGSLKCAVLPFCDMADEHADTDSAIMEAVRILKLKIPPSDHAALDSRVQELIHDPSTDDNDVIAILLDEFDPA